MTRPPPGRRAAYVRFQTLTTRWMDNDVFDHLNNVVYYSLFDTAVCQAFLDVGILTWHGGPHFMMAESGCRYHSEIAFPDRVTAGLRLAHIGTSSIRHEIAVFRNDDDLAAAEGFMVHVCVDPTTRRPVPLPPEWRKALAG